jgi:hypothetical protein
LLLKVWLYGYALGVTSSRRLEQRIQEDLGFRFLAGGWKPDHWTLNQFRRRHPKALNDVFKPGASIPCPFFLLTPVSFFDHFHLRFALPLM